MNLRKIKQSIQEKHGWSNKQSFRSRNEYPCDPYTGEPYPKKRVTIKCSIITRPVQSWRNHG
jgi:hypothetical protein